MFDPLTSALAIAAVIGAFAVIGVRAIATLNDTMLQRASAGFVALSVVLVGVAMIVYRSLLVASRICRRDAAGQTGQTAL